MAVSAGDKVPSVNFKMLTADGLSDVSSDDYFGGKKTALFAVPGAFTPTCSAKHVPSFLAQADALKAKGVDQIACVSVNDAFVMKAWGEDTGAGGTIDMLADGNGEFAQATGLTLDARGFGLGERTTRFSMIVDDGTITALNVEENPTEMIVSSAEHMLTQL
ncbi:MAG: peroxiredoxin [Rhodospirillales bacterium]|nr:peroxiredoxin [Rhodospirillales bacterium]